jgi:hypothetical protein
MKTGTVKKITTVIVMTIAISIFILSCQKAPVKTTSPSTQTSPVAAISRFSPASALPNSVISIKGSNFDTVLLKTTVTFNGVTASVYSINSTDIEVTVPTTATTGKVIVNNNGTTVTSTSNFTVTSGTVSTYVTGYFEHITFDGSGNMYGDNGSNTIYMVDNSGNGKISPFRTIAGTKVFWGTAAVSNASGILYFVNQTDHNINLITGVGGTVVYTGSNTGASGYFDALLQNALFTTPTGLVRDSLGNMYTNDSHRVRKILQGGTVTTLAGSGADGKADGQGTAATFGIIEGITVDKQGNVYVSDNKYLNIRKITPTGLVTTLAGSGTVGFVNGPGKTAQFYHPQGMAVDAAGNIFVSDNNFNAPDYEVRMINKLGVVTTFLKGTSMNGVTNGATNVATVNFPDGIAFDVFGNMYIANTGSSNSFPATVSKIVFK